LALGFDSLLIADSTMRWAAGQEEFQIQDSSKKRAGFIKIHDFEKKRFARCGARCLKEKHG
jgi:hypothetical protein